MLVFCGGINCNGLCLYNFITNIKLWCFPYFCGHQFNDFQVKGLKKLDNFQRKEDERDVYAKFATIEDQEYLDIQIALEKELHAAHLDAERIFAEAEENGITFYYVKWHGLPYSESTWEKFDIVESRFPQKLESFKKRENSSCTPRQCPALKHRPKFHSIKEQPDFLGNEVGVCTLISFQIKCMKFNEAMTYSIF